MTDDPIIVFAFEDLSVKIIWITRAGRVVDKSIIRVTGEQEREKEK